MVDGLPAAAVTTPGEFLHEREDIPTHQIKNRRIVQANTGEGCGAFLEFLRPHWAQAHDVDKEIERVFRAVHPQHDVVNVHGVSLSWHLALEVTRNHRKERRENNDG